MYGYRSKVPGGGGLGGRSEGWRCRSAVRSAGGGGVPMCGRRLETGGLVWMEACACCSEASVGVGVGVEGSGIGSWVALWVRVMEAGRVGVVGGGNRGVRDSI